MLRGKSRGREEREAVVAPLVARISPALLWSFEVAGWNVLGYEYAEGRHADYTPGSPDLDRLVHLMVALAQIQRPRQSRAVQAGRGALERLRGRPRHGTGLRRDHAYPLGLGPG